MKIADAQKVLIADDDAVNREVLGELLKPEYTVLLARNGPQALERAARHQPDLILLDVMMPDMDGYEVLRRLRADPQLAHIAVIFISGLDRPEDEAAGLKMGAADYIVKPFNQTVVMARVALHLQVVRQRRMLERLANVDGLTELANRRRFDEVYELEWQRARRSGRPLSLALLDVDAFKQYNDRYGHPAGDRALRAVARLAAGGMRRPSDLAARYGGEELVLLMPETDAGEAKAVVEGIREELARLAIPHETSSVAPVLTVSVGGATLAPGAREQSAELFEAADTHLYRAKQAGRNRIVWRAAQALERLDQHRSGASMKITKRPATEADLPYLMWLRRKTMDDHLRASGENPTDDYHAQRLHYRYDCADVLVRDNRPVGLLKVARDPGEWEIIQIQLDPSLQGQGVGRMLLEEIVSEAQHTGAHLTLKVLAANPARKLYEQLGFEACGVEGNEVRMRLRSRG